MNVDDNLEPNENLEESEDAQKQSEIIRNDYGDTKESTVVVEEEDRTVILTEDETIVIDKPETVDIIPGNRPRKVYAGMWGTPEIITVALALLAVLTVVLTYVFVVIPAETELEANRKDRDQVEVDLTSMQKKYGSMENEETAAVNLVRSVDDFETRFLKFPADGKSALYQRLNGLIRAYSLVNTSGPDYTPLEITNQNPGQRNEEERGRDKFLSLFPGVYVSVTVEGSYQNLRRFMSEVENSSEFITITSVELVPVEKEKKDTNSQPQPIAQNNMGTQFQGQVQGQFPGQPINEVQPPRQNGGKTRGEIVSLKIEMVSYFRRPDFQPLAVDFEQK
jgi:Tfp pilus assembly protein PilO